MARTRAPSCARRRRRSAGPRCRSASAPGRSAGRRGPGGARARRGDGGERRPASSTARPTCGAPPGAARAVRGVFVTGTDTGVGKTYLAAAIADSAARRGPARRHVQAGPDRARRRTGRTITSSCGGGRRRRTAFGPPVSPHLAAELAGRPDRPDAVVASVAAAARGADVVVVEGVGGLLVPLTSDYDVRDLARALGLPLVLAARPGPRHDQPHAADARGSGRGGARRARSRADPMARASRPSSSARTCDTLAREVPVETLAAGAGAEALPVAERLDAAPDPPLRTGARR